MVRGCLWTSSIQNISDVPLLREEGVTERGPDPEAELSQGEEKKKNACFPYPYQREHPHGSLVGAAATCTHGAGTGSSGNQGCSWASQSTKIPGGNPTSKQPNPSYPRESGNLHLDFPRGAWHLSVSSSLSVPFHATTMWIRSSWVAEDTWVTRSYRHFYQKETLRMPMLVTPSAQPRPLCLRPESRPHSCRKWLWHSHNGTYK